MRELCVFDAESANMDALVDSLSIEPRLALDTESDPFHRYYEKVCLVQISTPDRDLIYDPLAAGMAPRLKTLLGERQRTIVIHGADYDVRSLRRAFDLILGRIFDTSIAASILGMTELGLKALLASELQVTIDKTEQRSDWGRRPLTDEQLAYAASDTRHLLPLADKLQAKLDDAGRSAWMEEECDLLRFREPAEKVFDPEGYRSFAGAKNLGVSGRRALRALFTWREAEAEARDVPPFRVFPNEVLVAVSARIDREGALDAAQLSKIKRVSAEDHAAEQLAAVIRKGLEAEEPPESERMRDAVEKKVDRERFKARMERMKKIRSEQSTKLGIAPGFLAAAALLERIAKDPPASLDALRAVRGFTAWRVDAVGEELLAALEK